MLLNLTFAQIVKEIRAMDIGDTLECNFPNDKDAKDQATLLASLIIASGCELEGEISSTSVTIKRAS